MVRTHRFAKDPKQTTHAVGCSMLCCRPKRMDVMELPAFGDRVFQADFITKKRYRRVSGIEIKL